jgi:hypothetical protein
VRSSTGGHKEIIYRSIKNIHKKNETEHESASRFEDEHVLEHARGFSGSTGLDELGAKD